MSSDVHHDSSKRDRLLQKLMKIYEEPDQDNDKISSVIDIEQDLTDASATTEIGLEYSTDNGDDDIISAENVDKKDETKGSRNENKNNQSDQLCSKDGTLKIETLATAPNSHIELLCAKESTSKNETLAKAPNYTETLHDLQSFLETASFLHTSISVTADSKDTVCISAPNLRKLRVPLMNFQGYSVTGHTVVCKICNNMKSVDGKKHKWSDAHLKKVMLPLKKGYFRQVI